MANFLKHALAALTGAAPILVALEAAPGPVGKLALVAVSLGVSLGLFKLTPPAAK